MQINRNYSKFARFKICHEGIQHKKGTKVAS